MRKGLLITIEGGDGSGKSTQLAFIKKYLQEKKIDALITREPGGTSVGEKTRNLVLDPQNTEMAHLTEALLFAAARAQHVAEVIGPAIEKGEIVICDRYIDSSLVYQGEARGMGKPVYEMNKIAIGEYEPDATILLNITPQIVRERIEPAKRDRLEAEPDEFHRKVFDAYKELAKRFPERIIEIDASLPREEVSAQIEKHLEKLL